jgi:hypothetical protein
MKKIFSILISLVIDNDHSTQLILSKLELLAKNQTGLILVIF